MQYFKCIVLRQKVPKILGMTARRLVHILLALGPVLFLAAIGMYARFAVPPDTHPKQGEQATKRFLAYAPFVSRGHNLPSLNDIGQAEYVFALVDDLRAAKADGTLRPVYAMTLSNEPEQRALHEICVLRSRLFRRLVVLGDVAHTSGDLTTAINRYLDAAEIAQLNATSSYASLFDYAKEAHEILHVLAPLAEAMDSEQEARFRAELSAMRRLPHQYDRLSAHMDRLVLRALASDEVGHLVVAQFEQPRGWLAIAEQSELRTSLARMSPESEVIATTLTLSISARRAQLAIDELHNALEELEP